MCLQDVKVPATAGCMVDGIMNQASMYTVQFTVFDDILYTKNTVTGRSNLIPKKQFLSLPLVPLLLNILMQNKL